MKNTILLILISLILISCNNYESSQESIIKGCNSDTINTNNYISIIECSSSKIKKLFYDNEQLFVKFRALNADDFSLEWIVTYDNGQRTSFGSNTIKLAKNEDYTSILNISKCNYFNSKYNLIVKYEEGEVISPDIYITQTLDTEIPSVYITTQNFIDITSKESWLNANIEIKSEIYGNSFLAIQIKGRGNTSWSTEKKPYSFKLDNKQSLLGMENSKRWVLINNHVDKSLLRNQLASWIGNTIFDSYWNPNFISVDLILNGEYKGTYLLGESVKIDKKRVNIQSLDDCIKGKGKDLNGDGIVDKFDGGFICEINNVMESYFFSTIKGIPIITLKDPSINDFDNWNSELEDYIHNIVQSAEDVLYCNDWLDSENGYTKYFDVDSIIDWYLISDFLKSADAIFNTSVFFYYNPADGKIHFGPNWDFDDCAGNFKGYSEDFDLYNPKGFWIKDGAKTRNYTNDISAIWINRLFTDETFVQKVKLRWNNKKNDLYNLVNIKLRNYVNIIEKSANLNFRRYPILGSFVFEYYAAPGWEERISYQSEIEYLINWLNDRYIWFDSAINSL